MAPDASGPGFTVMDAPAEVWGTPDMDVLRLNPKPAPVLPLDCFGPAWAAWITETAAAAACPPDYVAAPLLAAASALIGNARWPQIGGWSEPPHLWLGAVGFSGDGKTPGASCLLRDVLPEIERRMAAGHPEKLREWKAAAEIAKAAKETWEKEVANAQRKGLAPPLPPADAPPEPIAPCLKISDVTIERVATLAARACPKGPLVVRDELAGWLLGMAAYNDAARPFWLEAWNGAPYRVDRQKHPEPIRIERLAVAVYGGVQPDKLAELTEGADDGLFARIMWCWPDPLPFRLGAKARPAWAIDALDRLRQLDMHMTEDGSMAPVMVALDDAIRPEMEDFGQDMQTRARDAGKLLGSAYAKARGQALRLSLVLEYLWWSGADTKAPPPATVGLAAFRGAARLMDEYCLPNAQRAYAADGITAKDRSATRLARWIVQTKAQAIHVRTLQRDVRLPGLDNAEAIHAAAAALIEADWLKPPEKGKGFGQRGTLTYPVNPAVHHG